MEEDLQLKALCIHGIQSTVGDWEELENELAHSLSIEHAQRRFFSERNLEFSIWEDAVVKYESELIRNSAHNILIAHSYGTHRAGRIMQQCPDLYGAILMNPPLNKMAAKERHQHRQDVPDDIFMNTLFHEITFDMSDNVYRLFIERQRRAYEKESKEIGRQGGYLKRGVPFIDRMSEIPETKEVLIIRSSGDQWDVGELPKRPKITEVDLGADFGHYPQSSKPRHVSEIIRSWLHERIFTASESDRMLLEEPVAYA